MFYIYRIVNMINNHDYIGRRKAPKSLSPSEDKYMGSGVLIKKAIQKYGKHNFKKEILESNLTFEEAIKREVFWIEDFKNRGLGIYNISPGCEGFSSKDLISEKALKEFNNHKANKVRENWKNLSEESYSLRTDHMKEAWANKTSSERESFSKKRSQIQKKVYSQLSSEQKQSINEKRISSLKEMHQQRSEKEQKIINSKISQSLIEYNNSLTGEQRKIISQKQSESRKRYALIESEEHKRARSRKISLSKGKWYKIITPKGEEIIIKGLSPWCRQEFGDKGNSASTTLHQRGSYKGYILLEEVPSPLEIK